MKIILSNIIEIQEPSKEIMDYCKKNLIYTNPNYIKKQRMGFYIGRTSKFIKLYEIYNDSLYLPIGLFNSIWNIHPVKEDYKDYSVVRPINVKSEIKLRDYQQPVVNAVKKYCNGLIIMPCGTGKSCTMLHTACMLQQKTLWLCTTKDLLIQAENYIKNFTNGTTSRITEGKCDYSGDFVFATVQTLCKVIDKREIPQDTFGCVIGDEVQHCMMSDESIMQFKTCIEYFSSRYKLGCTATLKTANELWKCIPKIIGDTIYELKKSEDKQKFIGYYEGKPIIEVNASNFQVPVKINIVKSPYNTLNKDIFDRNDNIVFTKLITSLATDLDRNKKVLDIINNCKGYTIVISERIDQLEWLHNRVDDSVYINGKTNKKIREQTINDFRNGEHRVLFASYSLVAEGLDVPILENLVMASPVKDERLVIQAVGRVQRPSSGKTIANVYDFIDDVSLFDKFTRNRLKIYKREGWKII